MVFSYLRISFHPEVHCQFKDRDAHMKQELLQNKYYFCFDAFSPFQPLLHIILLLLEACVQIPALHLAPGKLTTEFQCVWSLALPAHYLTAQMSLNPNSSPIH